MKLNLTQDQKENLLQNGFVKLPQLKSKFTNSEINSVINNSDITKTYNSKTEFHSKYIEEKEIEKELKNDLYEISKNNLNNTPNKNDVYYITRIVKSYDNLESYRGHFDSHLFTLVTPVTIPKTDFSESGQLIVFPKIRKEPRNEFHNFFGKLFYNFFYASSKGFKKLMKNKKYLEFDFSDNVPVLFLGRQCFHGNRGFSKKPNGIRVTLLTHFFDPSPKYGIGNILRKLRNR